MLKIFIFILTAKRGEIYLIKFFSRNSKDICPDFYLNKEIICLLNLQKVFYYIFAIGASL